MASSNARNRAASRTAPAPAPEVKADAAPEVTPDAQPDTAPAPTAVAVTPDAQPDTPVAEVTAEPTWNSLLQQAVSRDATLSHRTASMAASAALAASDMLDRLAARPDDQHIATGWMRFDLSGASGRGPAISRSLLTFARALFGAGYYVGDCHGRTKGRKIEVQVALPVAFHPVFIELAGAFTHPDGPVGAAESAAIQAGRARIKMSGLRNGETEYGLINKRSRMAMETTATAVADQIAIRFPVTHQHASVIREILQAVSQDLAIRGVTKNVTPVTDRYGIQPVPDAPESSEPAAVPVTASA